MRFFSCYQFLFLITSIFANCPSSRKNGLVLIRVNISQQVLLSCGCISSEDYKLTDYKTTWWKMDQPIKKPVSRNYQLQMNNLTIVSSERHDNGPFNCSVTDRAENLIADSRFYIEFFPHVWINDGNNEIAVIEEYAIDLRCYTVGLTGVVNVQWRHENRTFYANRTKFTSLDGVENARLFIKFSERTDRGVYYCTVDDEGGNSFETKVSIRIKGAYRAVWPFLGICLEVVTLLALINYLNHRWEERMESGRVEFTIHSLPSSSSFRTSRAYDEDIDDQFQSEAQEYYEDEDFVDEGGEYIGNGEEELANEEELIDDDKDLNSVEEKPIHDAEQLIHSGEELVPVVVEVTPVRASKKLVRENEELLVRGRDEFITTQEQTKLQNEDETTELKETTERNNALKIEQKEYEIDV